MLTLVSLVRRCRHENDAAHRFVISIRFNRLPRKMTNPANKKPKAGAISKILNFENDENERMR